MDLKTRREKQQKLMARLVERKVRARAQQLYEIRGQGEGHALRDWFQAEEEVLGNSILAPLYRRLRTETQHPSETASDSYASDSGGCETSA